MKFVALASALLFALPHAATAQRLTTFAPLPQDQVVVPPSKGRMFAGSMLGSGVGALVGWTAGVLVIYALNRDEDSFDEALGDAAVAALVGSAAATVLGGVGSRIGVRAAGGQGGPLGKHILASLAGWGASMVVLNVMYSSSDDPSPGGEILVLFGTHSLVTALLAPRR